MKVNDVKYLVIGAGIGGLAAGAKLKSKKKESFMIVEMNDALPNNLRNGMHYLHSTDFFMPFDLKFKECVLTENIWDTKTNTFNKEAMLPEIFEYSKKVMENLRHPSSIMDPGKRKCVYVPENNDMNTLVEEYYKYIGKEHFLFGTKLDRIESRKNIAVVVNKEGEETLIKYDYMITTAPIDKFTGITDIEALQDIGGFKSKELFVTNYTTKNIVPNWMIGLYMSDPKFPPYRISCFNSLISMESLAPIDHDAEVIIKYIIGDLFDYELSSKQEYSWKTGRIFGIDYQRRMEIVDLLTDCDIYPIGRYALWNGKLKMDDTINQANNLLDVITTANPDLEKARKTLYE